MNLYSTLVAMAVAVKITGEPDRTSDDALKSTKSGEALNLAMVTSLVPFAVNRSPTVLIANTGSFPGELANISTVFERLTTIAESSKAPYRHSIVTGEE